jgi:VIT1/CCC1 family predicted Fe2+/Mn2+ transporter
MDDEVVKILREQDNKICKVSERVGTLEEKDKQESIDIGKYTEQKQWHWTKTVGVFTIIGVIFGAIVWVIVYSLVNVFHIL